MPTRWAAVLGLSLGAAGVCLAVPREAFAQSVLAVDAEAAFPSNTGHDEGFGLGARFGHKWDLVLLSLTPELGVNYHAFGGPPDASSFAVVGGGRVGIGFVLEPSAFLHAGIGHVGYEALGEDYSHTSLAYEFGLALDFTLLPIIDLGAHAALAGIAGDEDTDSFSWLAVGGHIAFVFDDDDDDDDDDR